MIASHPMTTLQCPMVECRRRVDLDTVPVPPEQPVAPPCLHYIAAWDEPGGHPLPGSPETPPQEKEELIYGRYKYHR